MRKNAQATACEYAGSPLKVPSKTTNVTPGQAVPWLRIEPRTF